MACRYDVLKGHTGCNKTERYKPLNDLLMTGKLLINTFFPFVYTTPQVFNCHFNSNFFPLFLERLLGGSLSPGLGSFLIGVSFVVPHVNNLYFLSLCRKYGLYTVIKWLFYCKCVLCTVMFCFGPNHLWLLGLFIAR